MGNKSVTKKQQQPRRKKWNQNLRILPSLNQIKVNYNVRYLSTKKEAKKKIKSNERLTLHETTSKSKHIFACFDSVFVVNIVQEDENEKETPNESMCVCARN